MVLNKKLKIKNKKVHKVKRPTNLASKKKQKQTEPISQKDISPKVKSKVQGSKFTVSLVDLLEAGCHFGHQVRRWNPKMKRFIWKESGGVHLFDLAITAAKIQEAVEKIRELVKNGQNIVFVGTKRQAIEVVLAEAKRCGMPYVVSRWPGGLLTNWKQVSQSIQLLLKMKKEKADKVYDKYTKKENVLIDRKIVRLERLFGGLTALTGCPDALFIIDTVREKTALREARAQRALVIAMADSNSDPDMIDYPIPANDDALSSIKLVVGKMADAAIEGLKQRKDVIKAI